MMRLAAGCRHHRQTGSLPPLADALAAGYQPSTINYQLSTINYQLLTINYQLLAIN
jgi:hypothetical protein